MKKLVLSIALALTAISAPAARADALPMPVEMNEFQQLLVGIWREDTGVMPVGLGHGYTTRTIAFGNGSVAMLYFGGISYSNEYNAGAMIGSWTAERVDDKTLKVTMTQSPERGTEWTLVFEGDDAFVLTDSEWSNLPPSRFSRDGKKVTQNR